MRIGIPKELHDGEKRVATTPEVATQLQKLGFTVAIESGAGAAANFTDAAYAAAGVTIVRDDWGIPHISAKTDADAIFGMIYAQAEDDFNRVETNFLNGLGRLAEAEGEGEIRDRRCEIGDARSERPCTFASRLSVSSLFFRLSISYL